MLTSFHVYFLNSLVCFYGLLIFLWWWNKTGKATEIYIFITCLFAAECFEKSLLAFIRYILTYDKNPELFREIITSWYWSYISLPTTLVFLSITFLMTKRIYSTYRALKRSPEIIRPAGEPPKNVLVISSVTKTKEFMRGAFVGNGIEYHQSGNLCHSFEKLVTEKNISVVLIGLSCIEEASMKASDVVRIIKRENPWCVVVAMSRNPNLYELFETRRSYFDDYIYLPIDVPILIATYTRWLQRIRRWSGLGVRERRRRKGTLFNRSNLSVRDGEHKSYKEFGGKNE
jgi:DNA-binding response OmpR family regulator